MQTRAEKKGNSAYVLNGEEMVFVRGQRRRHRAGDGQDTNPDAPRHQQFSTFIVELPNPGYKIIRDIKTMAVEGPLSTSWAAGIRRSRSPISKCRRRICSAARGRASTWANIAWLTDACATALHNVAMAQRALDMATKQVTTRSTFGKKLAERQGVQFMLADCASELYMARLMLLHIAYKAERGMDLRQENGIAKVFLAHMVHKVVDTAIQLHGALGYSQDTPLASWYTHIRSQRLVDGPDEVHRWTVGAQRHQGV